MRGIVIPAWAARLHHFFLRTRRGKRALVVIAVLFFAWLLTHFLYVRPPAHAPAQSLVTIAKGETLSAAAEDLYRKGLIRSPRMFMLAVYLGEGGRGLKAGDYFLEKPLGVFSLAERLTTAEYGLTPFKVTIPEGTNIYEIAEILRARFPRFDAIAFLNSAKEGYMFPDTYHFLPNVSAEDVASTMRANFTAKLAEIEGTIASSTKPLADAIIIASILEEEARTTETRRMISGILWERLRIGMGLQVDVTFQYINGKNTYELTRSDLGIDSPYNTYKYAGLPPTPISNPGLDSIKAALDPAVSPYLYFLSDRRGTMYYARTFDEHVENRRRVGLTI